MKLLSQWLQGKKNLQRLPQKHYSKLWGISPSQLSQYLYNRVRLPMHVAERIALSTGLSIYELLRESNDGVDIRKKSIKQEPVKCPK